MCVLQTQVFQERQRCKREEMFVAHNKLRELLRVDVGCAPQPRMPRMYMVAASYSTVSAYFSLSTVVVVAQRLSLTVAADCWIFSLPTAAAHYAAEATLQFCPHQKKSVGT